jgi:succinoglycan biosynthesis protein ExoA
MSSLPKVSVVLPFKDEEKAVGEAVISLAKQDYSGAVEILAVNDGSKDDSQAILERAAHTYPYLRLIEHKGSGVAEARNAALSEASGEVVVNFSAHAFASKSFLSVLVAKLTECGADVAGVGCKHLAAADDPLFSRAFGTAIRSAFGGLGTTYHQQDTERLTESLAFTAYRAEVFRVLGGFDPKAVGNEDAEFNLRLSRAGYKLLYTPETIVYHHEVSSPSAFLRKMVRYGAGRARTVRKHNWSFKPIYAAPSMAVLFLVLLSLGSLLDGRLFQVLLGLIVAYVVCLLVSGIRLATKIGLVYVPALILAYPMIHFGYGIGFIAGFLRPRQPKLLENRPREMQSPVKKRDEVTSSFCSLARTPPNG